jgi:hypothetical protein
LLSVTGCDSFYCEGGYHPSAPTGLPKAATIVSVESAEVRGRHRFQAIAKYTNHDTI